MSVSEEYSASEIFFIYFLLMPLCVALIFMFGRAVDYKSLIVFFIIIPISFSFAINVMLSGERVASKKIRLFLRLLHGLFASIGLGGVCLGFVRYF